VDSQGDQAVPVGETIAGQRRPLQWRSLDHHNLGNLLIGSLERIILVNRALPRSDRVQGSGQNFLVFFQPRRCIAENKPVAGPQRHIR